MRAHPASGWRGVALAGLLAMACGGLHAADKPAPPREKLVCVTDAATGSHIRKRTCMTEAQMAERRKRDQETMSRMKGPVKPLPKGG